MKRYRIFIFDFDTRVHSLEPVGETWDARAKQFHEDNRSRTIEGLKYQYGEWCLEQKIKNFIDLKQKPISILAFHNRFLEQCRSAFVIGSYYAALTAACALGERILNHLVLRLRENYKNTPWYKKVYGKNSFDYWPLAIDTLESWSILLPEAAAKFRELSNKRNRALHFSADTDQNDRELALEAIHILQEIVNCQFSGFGTQPWLFIVPGECYIRQQWVDNPFIKLVYLPSCALVGSRHIVDSIHPRIIVNDKFIYENREITDDEFIELRKANNNRPSEASKLEDQEQRQPAHTLNECNPRTK